MATIDRIEPAYKAWSPSASGYPVVGDKEYLGRHRRPGVRGLGLLRMFYTGRHRRI